MRTVLAAMPVLIALACTSAWAAPDTSLRPQTRPQPEAASELPTADGAQTGARATPSGALERSPRPERRPVSSVTVGIVPPRTAAPPKTGAICGVDGLAGRHVAAVTSSTTGCGISDPVEITAVQGVRLSEALTMDCVAAKALNEWVRVVLQPTFANRVRRLDVAGAYVCRGRNNVRGAKVSEHGRGRAVDVSGLTFTDGGRITVAGDWNKGRDGQLMTKAYKAACGIFGTTLGPGSDGYHEDHMHFDVPSNRRSPYCR